MLSTLQTAARAAVVFGLGTVALAGLPAASHAGAPLPLSACQTIAVPGSYLVTKDITAGAFGCFTVSNSDITLDLGGHTIRGPVNLPGAGISISNPGKPPRTGIKLRNGTVGTFITGIYAPDTIGMVIENLNSNVNLEDGIDAGPGATIRNVQVRSNGKNGIRARAGSYIANVLADQNGLVGIDAEYGTTIKDSSESFSTWGITITANPTNVITGNLAEGNQLAGILVDCPAVVTGNKVPTFFPNTGRDMLARQTDFLVPGPFIRSIKCVQLQPEAVLTTTSKDDFPVK